MLLAALAACAWDAEYPGFAHLRNWDGNFSKQGLPPCTGTFPAPSYTQFDGHGPSPRLAKDLCAADPMCNAFRTQCWSPRFGYFARTLNVDPHHDIYRATNSSNSSSPRAVCQLEAGGCNSEATNWLHCVNDGWMGPTQVIGNLTGNPDLVHKTCMDNPNCSGFRITNDGAYGELLHPNPIPVGQSCLSRARDGCSFRRKGSVDLTVRSRAERGEARSDRGQGSIAPARDVYEGTSS